MQKLAATSKMFDNDTTSAFVSHMSDQFVEKCCDKIEQTIYNLF